MKKLNKLFAILIAVLGVGSLSAQTDVTSTYLTNADFESSVIFDGTSIGASGTNATPVSGSTLISGATNVYEISGWTNMTTETSDFARVFTMPYNTTLYVKSNGGNGSQAVTAPSNGSSVTENNNSLLFVEANWCNGATLGIKKDVTLEAGVYELKFDSYVTTNLQYGTSLCGVQVGSTTAYKWPTELNTWTNNSITFVVTSKQSATISMGYTKNSNQGGGNSPFLFVDNIQLLHKPFTDVTEANPVDLTSMSAGNWLNSSGATAGTTGTDACGGLTGVSEAYQWGNALATGEDMLNKTVTNLPSGLYTIEIYCASSTTSGRDNGNYVVTDGDEQYVTLVVEGNEQAIPTYNRTVVDPVPSYTFTDVNVSDGTLNLSVNINVASPNWLMAKVKSITYTGPDKSLEEANFATNITNLNALSTNNVPTAFVTKINNLKSAYGSADATSMTLSALIAANGEIKAVVDAHPSMVSAYANLDTYESVYENSTEVETGAKATYRTAIDEAKAEANNAVTVDEINSVIEELEAARQTYVLKADPTNGTYFDLTFKVINPKFDEGTNGWKSNTNSWSNSIASNQGGAITGNYYENWNETSYTGEIYQELTGLPSGKYKLTAAAFRDQLIKVDEVTVEEGDAVYVFANDAETLVNAATPAFYTVEVSAAGTLKIGVKSKVAKYKWMGIDNVSLHYYGYDVETAQTSVATLKTEAEALVGKAMNADVATALNAAIAGADATKTTRNELEPMIAALNSAVTNAKASIATYEAIPAYITKANSIDESIAAEYQIAYDNRTLAKSAETVFQELEVATYNYVITNFTYPVELEANGWVSEGPVGSLTGQHYDGTNSSSYMEQSTSAWSSSSWEISYKYEKTLPAGEYIFKVAGRHANGEGTTMALTVSNIDDLENPVVLGSVNDFPKSDTGLGINKAGVTSFDAKDEAGFANNGAGRGWQWRYVKFELGSETTVEVAVTAAATTNNQWMSFCDATVQMTEETYMDANIGGLDAPTAAAQALVDTKPMGTDENNALKEALAMAEPTTGAALLAKIEALETAVANANAWRSTYNTEKGKLVAALERFEADYNDAENGALDYMNKSRWETVIAKAQAAAVAKDDLTSHAGLTTATTELTAALDAATVSVGEYADLKAAIETAEPLYNGGNWGDQPFQRPASSKESLNTATAQATYDAATADGEDVTSLTEALNNGINTTLNAPEAGQRYYIKVATEGHSKLGNAVLATLGATGDNNPTGYGLNANNAVKGHLNQAFIFTQVEGNLYNISIERAEGTVYLTYGELNGSAAAWKKQQIQATTDAEKKGEFKIEATAKDGVLKIFNTVDNNYLDCQDGGSIYTDTGISAEEFNFVLASETEVTLKFSSIGWATLILPFDAELPESVRALTCAKADGEVLTLEEATSLKANTPYLMNGAAGTYTFSGYGLATKDSYTEGMFVGTYVDYQTTADGKTYVLQNQNNNLAFYLVQGTTLPWIRANRCYMTYEATGGEAAPMFILSRGDETSIDNMESTDNGQQTTVIYDLMGRKVNTMEKGGMYIVNGRKVVIK